MKTIKQDPADRALDIATRSKTHREAVNEIVFSGLADDPQEADYLIREGEDRLAERIY